MGNRNRGIHLFQLHGRKLSAEFGCFPIAAAKRFSGHGSLNRRATEKQ